MKNILIIMLFFFIMINNSVYSQSKIDVKYITKDDYINNDTIKQLPVQLDLFQNSYNKTIMNQYSLGSWTGDTIIIKLNGNSIRFVEYRKRSADFWLFENQYLRSIDTSYTISVDSFLVRSIDSIYFNLYCYYKYESNTEFKDNLQTLVKIKRDDIIGVYVYWPYYTSVEILNKSQKNNRIWNCIFKKNKRKGSVPSGAKKQSSNH
jgi:hypothetical protein